MRNAGKLNNMLMQMRKNANHPDLISSAFSNDAYYPTSAELRAECGKLALLDRLLIKLRAGGHKVLIFSQARCPDGGLGCDKGYQEGCY